MACTTTAEEGDTSRVHPFSEKEYREGIAALKKHQTACIDDLLVYKLNNIGPRLQKWVLEMFNTFFTTNNIPKLWRQSRMIVILKPGKYYSKELQTYIIALP